MLIVGPQRPARPLMVLCCALLAVSCAAGCNVIRDFLIPPETNAAVATRRAMARYASLVVDGAQVDGKRQAIALRNGRIVAIGPLAGMRDLRGPATRVIDGRGGVATPGLIDGHVRLDVAAMMRDAVDLRDVTDHATLRRRLALNSDLLRGDDWAWGWGLRSEVLAGLSADDLANIAPGLPILLSSGGGGEALLSRSLLSALPPRLRKPAEARRGRIDGALARRIWRSLPGPRASRLKPLLVQALSRLRDRGITTIHVMGASVAIWRILVDLERAHRLELRCLVYLDAAHLSTESALTERERQRAPVKGRSRAKSGNWQPRRVRLVGLELWLESEAPPAVAASAAGMKRRNAAEDRLLARWLSRADGAGLQLSVHVTDAHGAARVGRVLGAAKRPPGAAPIRLEGPGDLKLVAPRCGPQVVASIQPSMDGRTFSPHASQERVGERTWPALGLARQCTMVMGSALPLGPARPWHLFNDLAKGSMGPMTAADALSRLSTDHRGRVLKLAPSSLGDLVLWDRPWTPGGRAPLPTLVIVDGSLVRDVRFHAADIIEDAASTSAPLPQATTPPGT